MRTSNIHMIHNLQQAIRTVKYCSLLTSTFFSLLRKHISIKIVHSLFLGIEKVFDLILLHSKIFNTHDLTFVYFVLCSRFRWCEQTKLLPCYSHKNLNIDCGKCAWIEWITHKLCSKCKYISVLYILLYIWKADKLKNDRHMCYDESYPSLSNFYTISM